MNLTQNDHIGCSAILSRLDIELKRAERYRIFISLLIFDLSDIDQLSDIPTDQFSSKIEKLLHSKIRIFDCATILDSDKIICLLPETNRQGAETVSKRLAQAVKECISELYPNVGEFIIPTEMASYPDAAGAKSITDVMKEIENYNLN